MPELKMNVQLETLNLLITKECNLHCRICDSPIYRRKQEELTLESIRRIIGEAAGLGVKRLEITGGEPMLRPDVYEIIAAAKDLGLHTTMVSNGTLLGETEAERLLEAGLNDISISMDGFETTHDWIRGRGHFQKTLSALRCLVKRKARMGLIITGFTIIRRNFREMYDFTRFMLEEIGIHGVTFNPFNKWMLQVDKHEALQDFIIPGTELPELKLELDKILAYAQKGYPGAIFQHEAYFKKILDYFAGARMVPPGPCAQPFRGCGVESDGTVYPCWVEYVPAGNLKHSSLETIINGPEYQQICRMAAQNTCKGCLNSCYDVHAPAGRLKP